MSDKTDIKIEQSAKKTSKPLKAKLRSIAVDLLMIVLVVVGVSYWQNRGLIAQDQVAPNGDIPTLDGKISRVFESKKTLLYFFAPWCGVCKFVSPNVVRLQSWLSSESWDVKAIALDYDEEKTVSEFVNSHGMGELEVLLGSEMLLESYRVSAFPTFYFVEDGKVKGRAVGYTTTLGLWLRTLL